MPAGHWFHVILIAPNQIFKVVSGYVWIVGISVIIFASLKGVCVVGLYCNLYISTIKQSGPLKIVPHIRHSDKNYKQMLALMFENRHEAKDTPYLDLNFYYRACNHGATRFCFLSLFVFIFPFSCFLVQLIVSMHWVVEMDDRYSLSCSLVRSSP